MPSNKWKPPLWGKAKSDFKKAQKPQQSPPAKTVETAGRGSEMVKRTRPALNGPKPPGFGNQMAAQTFNQQLRKDHAAAKNQQPKKEISLEDREAIARLNEKFKKSAARERTQDKGL